jgi:hypothetical protein
MKRLAWHASAALSAATGTLLMATALTPSLAMTPTEVLQRFRAETNRSTPIARVDSIAAHVTAVMGLPPDKALRVRTIAASAVDSDFRHLAWGAVFPRREGALEALAFVFRRHGLLDPKASLQEILAEAVFDQTAGLYLPESHSIVLVEGASRESQYSTLLRQMVRAVQDRAANLNSLRQRAGTSFDAALALYGFLEGQSLMAEQVATKGWSPARGLTPAEDRPSRPYPDTDLLRLVRQIPWRHGLAFAMAQSEGHEVGGPLGALTYPPVSTQQLLHVEAYRARHEPTRPPLARQTEVLTESRVYRLEHVTTMGELYLRAILSRGRDAAAAGSPASHGWRGDTLAVLAAGRSQLFVWDTLWNGDDAARRFDRAYRRFTAERLGVGMAQGPAAFQVGMPDIDPEVFVHRRGNRVLIVEGDVDRYGAEQISEWLGLVESARRGPSLTGPPGLFNRADGALGRLAVDRRRRLGTPLPARTSSPGKKRAASLVESGPRPADGRLVIGAIAPFGESTRFVDP